MKACVITILVMGLVLLVRDFRAHWRDGIIDLPTVAGLVIGAAGLVYVLVDA